MQAKFSKYPYYLLLFNSSPEQNSKSVVMVLREIDYFTKEY